MLRGSILAAVAACAAASAVEAAETPQGQINYYYDASNMPSWLTPPWVTSAFRTGPIALPLPSEFGSKEGPMFAGVPAQPILPFDSQLPTDNKPISQNFVNYPTAAIPSGRFLQPGQAPPVEGAAAGAAPSLLETGSLTAAEAEVLRIRGEEEDRVAAWRRFYEAARTSRTYAMSDTRVTYR